MLLHVTRSESHVKTAPELSLYIAQIEILNHYDSYRAVVAANINILRRYSQYAYLYVNDCSGDDWLDSEDDDYDYIESLSRITISKNIWLNSDIPVQDRMSTIVNFGSNDLLPIIHLLYYEGYSLICLPKQEPIDSLANMMMKCEHPNEIAVQLLRNGGFILTNVDEYHLRIYTFDNRYSAFFQKNINNRMF